VWSTLLVCLVVVWCCGLCVFVCVGVVVFSLFSGVLVPLPLPPCVSLVVCGGVWCVGGGGGGGWGGGEGRVDDDGVTSKFFHTSCNLTLLGWIALCMTICYAS